MFKFSKTAKDAKIFCILIFLILNLNFFSFTFILTRLNYFFFFIETSLIFDFIDLPNDIALMLFCFALLDK